MALSISTLFPLKYRLWFGRLLLRPLNPFTQRRVSSPYDDELEAEHSLWTRAPEPDTTGTRGD